MASAAEKAKLDRIRGLVDRLKGSEWQVGSEGEGMILAAAGADGSNVIIARFTGHADLDEMDLAAGALDHCRFLLGLVDRAIAAMKAMKPAAEPATRQPKRKKPDHAAEAAMLCASPAFKKFLMERHGLESSATDERTAQKLRGLLGVTSRREINHDETVRERWVRLRADFNIWKGRALV